MQMCLEKLLAATTKSLESNDKAKQSSVVTLIEKFAASRTTSERTLLLCFRKMLFYLVLPKSLVAANATLCAEAMCQRKGILPKELYTWYKEQILSVVIRLAVSVYLEYGLMLDKTLANVILIVYCRHNQFIFYFFLVQRDAWLYEFKEGSYEK